jgi:microcystin-dependent protein
MALPNLTDQFVADTFKGVLHTANVPVNDENLPPVYDGLGNKSALRLGATKVLMGEEIQLGDFKFSYEILINLIFPIGSIFLSIDDVNPSTRMVGTTWERVSQGKFIAGVGTGTDQNSSVRSFSSGNINGEYGHTLTIGEMPTHTHPPNENPNFPFYVTWWKSGTINRQEAGNDSNKSYLFPERRPQAQTMSSVGGSASHNNIPPGYGVYVWRRTA